MRRLATAASATALLGGALFALPWLLVDEQALGRALTARLERELGRPVTVESVDLAALPLPALRARNLAIGGEPGAPPLLAADQVRLRVSLVALLAGRVALRSLEIDAPRLRLDVDESGRPVLPRPGAAARARGERRGAPADAEGLPFLAITRARVEGGSIEAGAWRVERLRASGSVNLDFTADVEIEADVSPLGKLREARLELSGFGPEGAVWRARGRVAGLDLASLRALLGVGGAVWGSVDGTLRAEGRGRNVERAALALDGTGLDVRAGGLELHGDASLAAELGRSVVLDLSAARLAVAGALEKPAGSPLSVELEIGRELSSASLRAVAVRGEAVDLRAALEWEGGSPRIALARSTLDFAPMREWWRVERHPTRGRAIVDGALVDPATRSWALHGALEDVTIALPASARSEAAGAPPRPPAELVANGPLALEQARIASDGLALALGGQQAHVSGHYDLAEQRFALALAVDGADLGALLAPFASELEPTGRLDARAELAGGLAPATWTGEGRLEIADAFLPGASIPWPGELRFLRRDAASGGELIDRFTAKLRLADSVARFGLLALDHPYASVELAGDVAVPGLALDLDGQVVVRGELDAELGGEGREHVLRVEHVGGTLARPEVRFDAESLQAMGKVFQSYAAYARAAQAAARADAQR